MVKSENYKKNVTSRFFGISDKKQNEYNNKLKEFNKCTTLIKKEFSNQ